MEEKQKSLSRLVLSVVILIGFFGVLAYVLMYGLPQEGLEVVIMMIGTLTTLVGVVGQFYLGSSEGSKSKDQTISQISATADKTLKG